MSYGVFRRRFRFTPRTARPWLRSFADGNPGTTDLVSYWSLDESSGTRNDSHGTNHLTDNNTVTSTTGVVSNAAQFASANSEYLSRVHASVSGLGGTDRDFTVCGWTNRTSGSSAAGVVGKWSSGVNGWLIYWTSATTLRFIVRNGATQTLRDVSGLSASTNYFFVARHDSVANTISMNVNDGTPTSTAHSAGVGDPTTDLQFAAYNTSNYFDGWVDEVGFWDKVLTSAEENWLYNSGSGRSYADISGTPPPVASDFPFSIYYGGVV